MTRTHSASGFTLIEVLLVTVLLFALAFATFVAVRATVLAKEDVDRTTGFYQEARAILALLDRDLRSAYLIHADDFVWKTKPILDPNTGQNIPPPPKPAPVTIFQGKNNEIFFSAGSHQRMTADSSEDFQHFVTYQLQGSKLVRAESLRAVSLRDRESADKFRQLTLIEDVKTFTLQYWDTRNDKWTETWDTERPEYGDKLPEAVKIELEYQPKVDNPDSEKKIPPIRLSTAVRLAEPALKHTNGATPAPGAAPTSPTTPGTSSSTGGHG